jgi:hypothetical protein
LRSLRAVASEDQWRSWRNFLDRLSPGHTELLDAVGQSGVSAADAVGVRGLLSPLGLPPIERAELTLALAGQKTSRISVSLSAAAQLSEALSPLSVPVFSRRVWTSVADAMNAGFSNVTDESYEYYRPPPGSFVYAYVGSRSDLARKTAIADERDDAGMYFDIPECCRAFFRECWPQAVKHHAGDLAAISIQRVEAGDSGPFPWQCNVWAMYLGMGLTWHFPCSLRCQETIRIVSARVRALRELDPHLCAELEAVQRRSLVLSPGRPLALLDVQTAHTDAISTVLHWTS